jgi:hypothetical protein
MQQDLLLSQVSLQLQLQATSPLAQSIGTGLGAFAAYQGVQGKA